ncbi:MAG TPA: patatin-like phospholipase family protein [Myxococcota bacterium]|nr:patatin-like phospholipase family protein [Myxococcota bacterium]
MRVFRGKIAWTTLFVLVSLSNWARASDRVRVLSIDGGGVRGIIPAIALAAIEKEVGKPIAQIFDLVAGTSTGGVLALALTAPNNRNEPVITAKQAVHHYIIQSSSIFQASFSHWLKTGGGLWGPRYESIGLLGLLKNQLGDALLSQALIPTIITGYHVEGRTGIEFSSIEAKKFPAEKDCLMRQVGMATSAAPIYFDAVDVEFGWGVLKTVVDGSLYAHNPSVIAYVNAVKTYPGKKIELYSLGTGLITPEQLSLQLKGRGLLQWAPPMIDHLQIGCTEADSSILHRLLNEDGQQNFFRLNVPVDHAHNSIDDTSVGNMRYLLEQGKKAVQSTIFKQMVERLKKSSV